MDLGFLFGILGTWIIVMWAVLSGGDVGFFINAPSIILVVGGTLTILIFSIPISEAKRVFGVARKAVFPEDNRVEQLIQDLVSYAEIARRDGILSLENLTKDMKDEFIVRGIQMAVDGTDPELIDQILTSELDNTAGRHERAKAILDTMGKYAPAMGMIGTLIGLVIMLQNMSDPSKIGPGMAVAILTTLYGALLANTVFGPMSDRLARRSGEEMLYKSIIVKGVMAIQSGDNPRIVEQKLRTFLPPSARRKDQAADERAA